MESPARVQGPGAMGHLRSPGAGGDRLRARVAGRGGGGRGEGGGEEGRGRGREGGGSTVWGLRLGFGGGGGGGKGFETGLACMFQGCIGLQQLSARAFRIRHGYKYRTLTGFDEGLLSV